VAYPQRRGVTSGSTSTGPLALKALGCRVIWLEGIDVDDSDTSPAGRPPQARWPCRRLASRPSRRGLEALRNWPTTLALLRDERSRCPGGRRPRLAGPRRRPLAADLLLKSVALRRPPPVVQRFPPVRGSSTTDPGLLQIWMTTGRRRSRVSHEHLLHDRRDGGSAGARRSPDGGRAWAVHAPLPSFLPEWPAPAAQRGPGRYTTVAALVGRNLRVSTATTFSNEKRSSFLEYQDLPQRTPVPLELAVCLAEFHEEYRRMLEPKGWRPAGRMGT